MRLSPLLILGALAFPSAPALAQQAYPGVEILDAFRAACSDLASQDAAAAAALSNGWAEEADPAATPLAGLVAFSRAQGKQAILAAGGAMLPARVFRGRVAGEDLYLLITGVTMEADQLIDCRLYDPGEMRRIDRAVAEQWVGRSPAQAVEREGAAKYSFRPGLERDHREFDIYFLPEGSPPAAQLQISGVALAASRSGRTDAATHGDSKEQK